MSAYLDQLNALRARHEGGEFLSTAEHTQLLRLLTLTMDERAELVAEGSLLTSTPKERARNLARCPVVDLNKQRTLRRGH